MTKATSLSKSRIGSEASRRKPGEQNGRQPDRQHGAGVHAAGEPIPREEIERRAYEYYLARGAQHGDDLGDWLRAEAELEAVRRSRLAA